MEEICKKIRGGKKQVKIALVGKYFATGNYVLKDSYICVIEAIKHACAFLGGDSNYGMDKFERQV